MFKKQRIYRITLFIVLCFDLIFNCNYPYTTDVFVYSSKNIRNDNMFCLSNVFLRNKLHASTEEILRVLFIKRGEFVL